MYQWQDNWEDYYAILGATRNSTPEQIKEAWRDFAHDHHPDKFRSEAARKRAEAEFKAGNRGYEVLSSDVERFDYNREYDARHGFKTGRSNYPPPPKSKANASESRNSSSGNSGSKKEESQTPPPPPPRIYSPIIKSSESHIELDSVIGNKETITFQVHHVSGELPPRWILEFKTNGVLLQYGYVSYYPKDSLPTTVTVQIHPEETGEFSGEISVTLIEIY